MVETAINIFKDQEQEPGKYDTQTKNIILTYYLIIIKITLKQW